MKFFIVRRLCQPSSTSSHAGGLAHNLGRGDQCFIAMFRTQDKPRSETGSAVGVVAAQNACFGVCTMCTLWASDWAVWVSDRAGFRMFPGLPNVCKGWNAVRVPPRAQHIPSSEGVLLLMC